MPACQPKLARPACTSLCQSFRRNYFIVNRKSYAGQVPYKASINGGEGAAAGVGVDVWMWSEVRSERRRMRWAAVHVHEMRFDVS